MFDNKIINYAKMPYHRDPIKVAAIPNNFLAKLLTMVYNQAQSIQVSPTPPNDQENT